MDRQCRDGNHLHRDGPTEILHGDLAGDGEGDPAPHQVCHPSPPANSNKTATDIIKLLDRKLRTLDLVAVRTIMRLDQFLLFLPGTREVPNQGNSSI